MWVKQCHKPPKLGIVYSTVIKMVMTGGWFIIVLTTLYIYIYIYIYACWLVVWNMNFMTFHMLFIIVLPTLLGMIIDGYGGTPK